MTTAAVGALRVFSGQEKADRVEKFVTMAREAIDECGNGSTRLGLSTYAILGWAYDINVATLGQDVVRFAPLVDIISPMAYPATFTSPEYYIPGKSKGSRDYWLVYRTLTGYAELLGPEHQDKIRPWIQGYYVYRIKSKNCHRLSFSTLDTLKLFKIMYTGSHKLFLPRKKLIFEKFIEMRP
jgi:hypothetical protein